MRSASPALSHKAQQNAYLSWVDQVNVRMLPEFFELVSPNPNAKTSRRETRGKCDQYVRGEHLVAEGIDLVSVRGEPQSPKNDKLTPPFRGNSTLLRCMTALSGCP